ncbi:PAS domain-containing protein [Sphingomonas sp. DT-51]|uniref:PAS domain-containing protein n=1 Tax=Sphingomonas sp. DT-51 TaxID=3396165 RepID=UPI003F1DD86A
MNSLQHDAAAVSRLDTIDKILEAACRLTGMRFAAVARVTADRWLACAVRDEIAFGLEPGGELDVRSTLCHEVGICRRTIAIDHVSEDPEFRNHQTPKQYGFQSYISAPILRRGEFFGTLCALDPEPARPRDPAISATFELFAELIGRHLETEASLLRSAALVELADRVRSLDDPAAISFAAAEVLGRTLEVDRSGYADVDATAETVLISRDWTPSGATSLAGLHRFRSFGSYVDELKRGEPVVIENVRDDPRTARTAHALEGVGVRAFVNLPVVEDGRLVAILFLLTGTPRQWLHGELAFVREVADRTRSAIERRRAERELERLNETLEAQVVERTAERDRMWDTSPDLMLVIDFNGVFRRVNPAWTKLLGYAPEELIGHHVNEFVIPDDHAETTKAYELAAAGGEPSVVNGYLHKDGTLRWISWVAAQAGDMTYATGRDVTAEISRAAEVRRYREIIEATAAPICAFDTNYRLIAFNKAHNDEFRRVNGFNTRVGDVFPELFAPEQRPRMRALMGRALSGERFTVQEEFGRPEFGTPCWEISYTPLKDEGGRVIGAFHQATDISERLLAEAELATAQEALRHSQKMEAMGTLTGGVAHDFNNLLTPIIGSLDMLVRKGIGNDRERRLIDGALQSAERAKTLVQRLLAFARRQPLQPVAVDVGQLVTGMTDLIVSTLGPTIDVRVDIASDLPPALADLNQLEMALLNLAVNARDAMPDGGELTITATRASVREKRRADLKRGHYVRLCVTDTGIGMDRPTLQRATEPFFSTKGIGKGTGLGLSMVQGLAAQLGGGLLIESTPGCGTSIELWLPISAAATSDETIAAHTLPARNSRGTALLVDDEELVRMSTADMLMDLGFEVVEATSGEEALQLIRTGFEPDVLVSDHLMPGISGVDLARAARELQPTLPVLIVSGYAEVEGLAPDLPRLTKPFRNTELAASVALIESGR